MVRQINFSKNVHSNIFCLLYASESCHFSLRNGVSVPSWIWAGNFDYSDSQWNMAKMVPWDFRAARSLKRYSFSLMFISQSLSLSPLPHCPLPCVCLSLLTLENTITRLWKNTCSMKRLSVSVLVSPPAVPPRVSADGQYRPQETWMRRLQRISSPSLHIAPNDPELSRSKLWPPNPV